MESYEQAYLEMIVENMAASMANCMRDGVVDFEMVAGPDHLTDRGRLWVCGYMTSRLSMIRAGTHGNPNLSTADLTRLKDLVEQHESAIAAELYS
ncbi:hypothetical protein ACFR9U_21105 [Halorientalis brevis]|uniref:Uncharacterized protein n=1 Tax=Halorientalis brevis TaxID=1126241 RepID=A0ABD6CGW9_9EURY|nr:hypothetical protein [Halorientalis brevis]